MTEILPASTTVLAIAPRGATLHATAVSKHIRCSPATVCWGYLDASVSDVATVSCGERVTIDTVSGNRSRLPDRERFDWLADHLEVLSVCKPRLGPHILTGPVHIRAAEPGQLLSVQLESVRLRQNWGWNEIEPGGGAIPELETAVETVTIPIDSASGEITLPWGVKVAAAPFFGILAVKPRPEDGALSSVIPGYFGGNMDIRALGAGAEIFFPVHCPGAGLFVGDGHALQGDGEIVGTAVETALTGEFTFGLAENVTDTQFPFALLPDRLVTTAFDESIDRAVGIAVRQAIKLLATRWVLNQKDAYRHCSLLGNLSVSQVVNVKKSVHFSVSTVGLATR